MYRNAVRGHFVLKLKQLGTDLCLPVLAIYIGNNSEKPYIPRVCGNFLYFLTCKSNADQFRAIKHCSVFQKCKSPVEIATAESDSVIIRIKCEQWCNDDVKSLSSDEFSVSGFVNTERIQVKSSVRCNFLKCHVLPFLDNWRKNALFHAPCARNDSPRINFAGHWQITCDVFAALKPCRVTDGAGNFFGCVCAFVRC